MTAPLGFLFDAHCDKIEGAGFTCMTCDVEPATGHVTVDGGPNHGRLLALLCASCASEDAWHIVCRRFSEWGASQQLDLEDLGPGALGGPWVKHGDHHDPLPDEPMHESRADRR